jgi:hypothetical protein
MMADGRWVTTCHTPYKHEGVEGRDRTSDETCKRPSHCPRMLFWLGILIHVNSLQAYPCIAKCIRVHSEMLGLIGIKSGSAPAHLLII